MRLNSLGNLAVLAMLAVTACQPPQSIDFGSAPATTAFQAATYALQPGDVVGINVFENTDLSSTYRVPTVGTVEFPLIGQVRLSGQTTDMVDNDITERLGDGFIVDPQVTVEVIEYRPVFVLGGVRIPGIVPYQPGMTVLGAVAASGGHSQFAVLNLPPSIIRATDATKTKVPATMADPIGPGDIIEIPERIVR